MKVRALVHSQISGLKLAPGAEADLPDETARYYIQRGRLAPLPTGPFTSKKTDDKKPRKP